MTHESGPVVHRKVALVILLIVAVQAAGGQVRNAVFVLLILWAMRSSISAIQSVSLATVVIFTNTAIARDGGALSVLKWLLLAVALTRVSLDRFSKKRSVPKILLPFFVFCLYAIVTGVAASAMYMVTIYKVLVFMVGVLIAMFGYSETLWKYNWASWFYTVFFTVLVMSIPFLFFGVGYDPTGRLFSGVFCHPQAFGVFIAPFSAWLITEYLKNRGRRELLLLFGLTFTMLVFTRARTSMLAFALGFGTTYISGFFNHQSRVMFRSTRFVFVTTSVLLVLLVAYVAANRSFTTGITGYIVKRYQPHEGAEMDAILYSVQNSRLGQIDDSLDNFSYNPIFGVGFGMTDRYGTTQKGDTTFLGIPLSTESEMGFILLAVLGQTGILGSILFLVFLWYLYKPIILYGDPRWIALSTTAFFVNFGEAILFSSGGLGAFSWLLIGYAYFESNARKNSHLRTSYIPVPATT